jgi:hypothetical protein
VSERPKERASKAREVQASAGSNPAATASLIRRNADPATRWAPAFEVLVSSLVSSGYISIVSFAVWAGPEQHVEPIRHVAVNRSNDVCVAAYHRGR